MFLKVAHNLGNITCSNIVNELSDAFQAYLTHTFAHGLSNRTKNWCKVFTYHFRIILNGRVCKGFADCCCCIVALSMSGKDTFTLCISAIHYLSTHTFCCICSSPYRTSCCSHRCCSCHITCYTRTNLGSNIFLDVVLHGLLPKTLQCIACHNGWCCMPCSCCWVDTHFKHKRYALCCHLTSLISSSHLWTEICISCKFNSLCIEKHLLASCQFISSVVGIKCCH